MGDVDGFGSDMVRGGVSAIKREEERETPVTINIDSVFNYWG